MQWYNLEEGRGGMTVESRFRVVRCLRDPLAEHLAVSAVCSARRRSAVPIAVDAKAGLTLAFTVAVDIWKLHGERRLCPRCRREAAPTPRARGDKSTTSHPGALYYLLGYVHR